MIHITKNHAGTAELIIPEDTREKNGEYEFEFNFDLTKGDTMMFIHTHKYFNNNGELQYYRTKDLIIAKIIYFILTKIFRRKLSYTIYPYVVHIKY